MIGVVSACLDVPAEPNQKLVEIDDAVLVLVQCAHGAGNVVGRPAEIGAELSEAGDVDETGAFWVVSLKVLDSPLNDRIVRGIQHLGAIGVLPPGKELFEGDVARRRERKRAVSYRVRKTLLIASSPHCTNLDRLGRHLVL